MKKKMEKDRKRLKRKLHIRSKVNGSAERPRLSVFRSNRHFSVQAIDDVQGTTMASVSDLEKEFAGISTNLVGVKKLGTAIAARLKEKKIGTIVFDRNGYRYHGVIKSFADAIREAGIQF